MRVLACLKTAGRNACLSLALIAVSYEPTFSAYSTQQPPAQTATVTAAVQASFGTALEAVTGFQPFYVTGDFNGDAIQDIAVVVRIKGPRSALPKDVRLVNPFWKSPKVTYPTNPAAENKVGLAIIHSWKTQTATKFLLIGEAGILVFDYDRTSDPTGAKNLIDVMKKRGKRPAGMEYPRGARGDVILLFTQVGDETPLFWNGRTYRWIEGGYD